MVPAQAALRPAGVFLDVVTQGVAGFASLADGVDPVVVAAALLPPVFAVVPDLAALDLQADDAGALYRDDEVDLVVLEVIGDALAGDDEVVGFELLDQRLVDLALGGVGQARRFVGRDGHVVALHGVRPVRVRRRIRPFSASSNACPREYDRQSTSVAHDPPRRLMQ